VAGVVEGHGVDGVDLVLAVEVGIKGIHHHDKLPGRRPPLAGVDDEDAIQPLVDVAL